MGRKYEPVMAWATGSKKAAMPKAKGKMPWGQKAKMGGLVVSLLLVMLGEKVVDDDCC